MEEVLTVHFLRNDHWWRDVEIWLYTHRLSIFIAPKYPTIHPTFLRLLNLNTQIHAYRLIYDFLLYRKIKFLINSTAFKIKYLGKISRFSFQNYLQSNKINKCLLFRALKRRGEKKKRKKTTLNCSLCISTINHYITNFGTKCKKCTMTISTSMRWRANCILILQLDHFKVKKLGFLTIHHTGSIKILIGLKKKQIKTSSVEINFTRKTRRK